MIRLPLALWREDTPRLSIGEAGSLPCAHTDICPQLELAHFAADLLREVEPRLAKFKKAAERDARQRKDAA